MSNPEQQYDERGVRKSKRQRVPNQYYTAGINELKKITLKTQNRKNRTDEEEDYSEQDQRNNNSGYYRNGDSNNNYQRSDNSGSWLPCLLPNNKFIKVQIVLDSQQNDIVKIAEEPKKQAPQPVFTGSYNSGTIKKADSLNLLSLFQQAIKNVANQVPSPLKHTSYSNSLYYSAAIDEPILKHQQSSQKPPKVAPITVPHKRPIQQDKDGKILSLTVDRQARVLRINHSKLGQCQVPVEVQPPSWNQKVQDEQQQKQNLKTIEQFRNKLSQIPSILKSISIFN